ncbi:hypothetical protein ACFPRL_13540 [Pseudoclavibacter helvolus]
MVDAPPCHDERLAEQIGGVGRDAYAPPEVTEQVSRVRIVECFELHLPVIASTSADHAAPPGVSAPHSPAISRDTPPSR